MNTDAWAIGTGAANFIMCRITPELAMHARALLPRYTEHSRSALLWTTVEVTAAAAAPSAQTPERCGPTNEVREALARLAMTKDDAFPLIDETDDARDEEERGS
jgi:hypothetical protein